MQITCNVPQDDGAGSGIALTYDARNASTYVLVLGWTEEDSQKLLRPEDMSEIVTLHPFDTLADWFKITLGRTLDRMRSTFYEVQRLANMPPTLPGSFASLTATQRRENLSARARAIISATRRWPPILRTFMDTIDRLVEQRYYRASLTSAEDVRERARLDLISSVMKDQFRLKVRDWEIFAREAEEMLGPSAERPV